MTTNDGVDGTQHQYLTFFVAGEEYALGILQVKEIVEYTPVTRMPSMPATIRGVTNLRGRVVPVVDLAVRFGFAETAITKWTCVVMVEAELDGEPSVVGLLVDAVSQVVELPPAEIELPPSFGTRVRVDFIQGMGKLGSKFVLVLDLPRLLETADLVLEPGALAAAVDAAAGPEPVAGEGQGADAPQPEPCAAGEAQAPPSAAAPQASEGGA